MITSDTTVFDYGCGHGADIQYLKRRGIKAYGWDPFFKPRAKQRSSDVVNIGYVLNTIEDKGERRSALEQAFELAQKTLVVSVRVDKAPDGFKEFGDGYLTNRDTFQKLYSQSEFKDYVGQILSRRVQTAPLGVAYVFSDEDEESRFLANRAFTRRLEYRTDLIAQFEKDPAARRFVKLANKLGRIPHADEFKAYAQLVESFGSPQRIERLALRSVDPKRFEGSRDQRKEDILTYLAMMRLQGIKAPRLSHLAPRIRRDIKSIWPRFGSALAEADQFLFSLGRAGYIKEVCEGH